MNINWPQFLSQLTPWGLPLVAGLVLLVVAPFLKNHHRFSFTVAIAACLASLWIGWQNLFLAPALVMQGNTTGLFLFDKFTTFFVILFLLAAILTLSLSYNYLKTFGLARPEYYVLILFAVFGMGCMAAGHDLMVVFLGLEIMSVAVYVLAGFRRSHQPCVEASFKYFLVGAFASAFLLMGIAFLYGATGTTDLIILHQNGAALFNTETRTLLLIGMALLGVGLGFKIAAVPFHYWAADVYEGAPIVVTSFMATAVKVAGFAALLRVVWALFQWEPTFLTNVVWIAAVITMTVGNIAALLQKNLKRMLAFSSIAHAGYALVPLVAYAARGAEAVSAVEFYLLAYILMTTGAFAVLIALTQGMDKEQVHINDLQGLGYQKPFLGFAMAIFLLSLAGIPPTLGFFGKYFLFIQAVQAGYIWLVIFAVLNSVISVYYYLSPVVAMYFGKPTEEFPYGARHPVGISPGARLLIAILLLAILYFGLFPSRLIELIYTVH